MNVEEFIAEQRKIIAGTGIDAYLPVCYVESSEAIHIGVLEDPPDDDQLDPLVKGWAEHIAGDSDFVAAFRLDSKQLKVLARRDGELLEQIVPIEQ